MAFKHDNNDIYILLSARSSMLNKSYAGIEFDNNGDGAHMGNSESLYDAVFISPLFAPNEIRDAFLTGFSNPTYDDQANGINNWEGKLAFSNGR